MPVSRKLIEKIKRAIKKEYPTYSIKRRTRITNSIIYGRLRR